VGGSFGNLKENTLPVCQLSVIQRIVSKLCSSKYASSNPQWFWIDTLCVPLAYLDDPNARSIVTKSIRFISQSAKQTVVIDADHSLLKSCSDEKEVFIRMAYSSWSSRLWTLLEAVYARRLIFHFSDQDVELDAWIRQYENRVPSWQMAWCVRFPYRLWRQYLDWESKSHAPWRDEQIHFLRNVLVGRATSVESDEPLIIANLLGIDPDDVDGRLKLSKCMRVLGRTAGRTD